MNEQRSARSVVLEGPTFAPNEIERSIGRVRHPEKMIDLDEVQRAELLMAPEPETGRVVLVVIVMRCATIGPFESPQAAWTWWEAPFNQLRRESAVLVSCEK